MTASRETILQKIRTALGRVPGQPPPALPPPMLTSPEMDLEARVASFILHFEALAGNAVRVSDTRAAGQWVSTFYHDRTAIVANSAYLGECGIIPTGITDVDELRRACAVADIGITTVDFALAQTGTMVMISSPAQARLISLLPPVHIAVFPKTALLVGLDDLLTRLPNPAASTSSMVLITGPSRTADIEQILVRGVHGPGEIHAVIVG